uniref:Uncharacterized protein n=1 Tax=Arundo donax TaxID=35708 RepID=A0A0A9BWK9_ARUDO
MPCISFFTPALWQLIWIEVHRCFCKG